MRGWGVPRFIHRLASDESGATAIEYGLIVALIFLVAVSAITSFANNTTAMYNTISAAIVSAH
jgi:pilus assembly protein Flp/PilA